MATGSAIATTPCTVNSAQDWKNCMEAIVHRHKNVGIRCCRVTSDEWA